MKLTPTFILIVILLFSIFALAALSQKQAQKQTASYTLENDR